MGRLSCWGYRSERSSPQLSAFSPRSEQQSASSLRGSRLFLHFKLELAFNLDPGNARQDFFKLSCVRIRAFPFAIPLQRISSRVIGRNHHAVFPRDSWTQFLQMTQVPDPNSNGV